MTYDDLKTLHVNELLAKLREQIMVAQNAWSPHTLCRPFEGEGFKPPTLGFIGDFEIRARDYSPKSECVEYKPLT